MLIIVRVAIFIIKLSAFFELALNFTNELQLLVYIGCEQQINQ